MDSLIEKQLRLATDALFKIAENECRCDEEAGWECDCGLRHEQLAEDTIAEMVKLEDPNFTLLDTLRHQTK